MMIKNQKMGMKIGIRIKDVMTRMRPWCSKTMNPRSFRQLCSFKSGALKQLRDRKSGKKQRC